MKKYNVEYGLLKTLKHTEKNELYYTILKIINGKYKFKIEYLNDVPLEIILIYLEKFLAVSNGFVPKNEKETFESLYYFMENIDNLGMKDLNANNLINIKYNLKVSLVKFKGKNLNKKTAIKITNLILFLSLVMGTALKTIDASNEMVIENDENLKGFDSSFVVNDTLISKPVPETDENIIINEDIISGPIEVNKDDIIVKPVDLIKEEVIEPAKLSVDNKIEIILENYNLTMEEFDVLCAIVMTEAKANSYEDAYAVINTMYNRITNKVWVDYISDVWGRDVGRSLYYQAITTGQFVVYENGMYLRNIGVREGDSFQAILDFLLTKDIKHNYLSFKSSDTNLETYEQFVIGGNKYHDPMMEEDRIIEEETARKI